MKFNLIQIASIFAVFQSLLICGYLIQNRRRAALNSYFLAGILLCYSTMILCSLILSSGINIKLFLYAHIGNQVVFLLGPLLYFYIKSRLVKGFTLKKADLVHAVPFFVVVFYLAIKFFVVPIPITCRSNHILVGSLAFIQSFGYFYVSACLLWKNDFSFKSLFRLPRENQMALLSFFICGCFLIWLTKLLFFLVWDMSGYYKVCNEFNNLFFLVSFLFFNTLLYLLLTKPQCFINPGKYKHSSLEEKEKQVYEKKLITHMKDTQIHRNSLLTLTHLAKQLSVPERYLSQIINESLQMSFYDFVNWYRINDCIHCLSDPAQANKTILSIAYDVGFNSKSTFNTAFKKYVGVTPKEYRRNHENISYK